MIMNSNNNNSGSFLFFSALVAKAQNTLDTEKAKKIKSNLISWGLAGTIIGGLLTLGCFIAFVLGGISSTQNMNYGFDASILIPFFAIIPCALLTNVGVCALKAGIAIVIAKATVEFTNLNGRCPKCGDPVEEGEQYCNKCGAPLLVSHLCKECGYQNRKGDKFCKNCGKPLEEGLSYEDRVCKYCGKRIKKDDTYCQGCGKKL